MSEDRFRQQSSLHERPRPGKILHKKKSTKKFHKNHAHDAESSITPGKALSFHPFHPYPEMITLFLALTPIEWMQKELQ